MSMGPLKLSTLINEEKITTRIKEIGAELTDKFRGKDVVAISVLNGSFMFFADLVREIETDIACEFLGVSSYGAATKSSGQVKVTLDMSTDLSNKHVIIVEDIIDSGLTMNYMQHMINLRSPESITTVTLLHKPGAKKVGCDIDHIGFEIPNDFVVGYGLDYNGLYRNLPYIAQVQNIN